MGCCSSVLDRSPGLLEYGDGVPISTVDTVLAAVMRLNGRYTFGEQQQFRLSKQDQAGSELTLPRYATGTKDAPPCEALRADEMWILAPDVTGDQEDIVVWRSCNRATEWEVLSLQLAHERLQFASTQIPSDALDTHARDCLEAYLAFLQRQKVSGAGSKMRQCRRGMMIAGM